MIVMSSFVYFFHFRRKGIIINTILFVTYTVQYGPKKKGFLFPLKYERYRVRQVASSALATHGRHNECKENFSASIKI